MNEKRYAYAGHDDDWAKAAAGFAKTSTANNATHLARMRTRFFKSLTLSAAADFQTIDSFMILLQALSGK